MTIKEAHAVMEDLQRIFTQNRFIFSNKLAEANGLAILALEKQMELNHLIDKIGDETDDKDKLKLLEEKLDQLLKSLKEKLDQLEKDVNRLKNSRTVEVRPVYPNASSTGISAYAGPEFNGICTGLPTSSSTTFLWGENDDKERSN